MDKEQKTGLFDELLEDEKIKNTTNFKNRKHWYWIAIAGTLIILAFLSIYHFTKKPHEKLADVKPGGVVNALPAPNGPAPQDIPKPENTTPPTPPPPAKQLPEPVRRFSDIAQADWKSIGMFIAQKADQQKITRSFLSDWLGLTACDAWQHDNRDEFAMEEHRTKIRASITTAPPVRRVCIKLNTKLGEYDFDKQAFPLDPIRKGNSFHIPVNHRCNGFSLGRTNDGFPTSLSVMLADDTPWAASLPMEKQAARTLVAQMAGNRDVTANLVVDLDINPNDRLGLLAGKPVAMFLWRGSQCIGAVGQYEPEAISIPETPPEVVKEEKFNNSEVSDAPPSQIVATSPRPDRGRMMSFISGCLRANEQKEMDKVLSFYGDTVDYYKYGKISKNQIRQDKETFFNAWQKLTYTLHDDLTITKIGASDAVQLQFTFDFEMVTPKNTQNKTAKNTWYIENAATNPRIIAEKQTVLKRN